ncbi:MAG: NAD(P)/FAD-dependent oxidoreductase [Acidobacteriota bacterium]|nr:NAD(P)/FAD-dependent oxidoreductase [Acidobacteriota bacterium]
MKNRGAVSALDAIVVGAGPNGLAAAIALAREGLSVRVYEAQDQAGGGLRSAALTAPGYVHDVCATVHALALASPFLRTLPLTAHGFEPVQPDAPFAHPLDDGGAVVVERSIAATADALERADGRAYRRLFAPLAARADDVMEALLAPPGTRHPLLMARIGITAIRSAHGLARRFESARTRAMIAGVAAHAIVPLDFGGTAGYTLGLSLAAHGYGWPIARGGSQRLADALSAHLISLGGEVVTGSPVASLDDLPASRAVLCDISPGQLIAMSGARMPAGYRRRLAAFRRGPGVFKMDWALCAPVPWRAGACRRAGTVHLGGSFEAIADSEEAAWRGRVHDRPYVLAVQPTLWDASRAPAGGHTLWAYCHVPNGATTDMTARVEDQIERFAPGFRDTIVARHAMGPAAMEARNANLAGGDIAGGAGDLAQVLMRPLLSASPYVTAIDDVYLCSSSTPPGVGVHGMCGYFAARAALRRTFGRSPTPLRG